MMSGQPQEWQTDVFRSSLVRKLEEAIRDSGNQTEKNAVDLEKQVFHRAKSKEEYLGYVARLILHVRQQSGGQSQGVGGDVGDMMGMGGPGGMMGGPGQARQGLMQQQGMRQQMQMQGGMTMQQQQQQQQMQMQQQQQAQQQQRMMQMNIQQQQQVNIRMQQRPGMSQLEQRLQQQQQQQHNQAQQPGMMMQRGGVMQRMPGPPMQRPPPPGYIRGPSPGLNVSSPALMPQGPSPVPTYAQSPQQLQQPSPGQGGMVPSPMSKQNNSLNPSPSSGVNTPGAPASQEDREYLEKVKQLEKYIEPLRRMIHKIGNENDQDRLTKMKKLLDILSNPDKRMPIATLQKCEDVLKRMALDTVEQGGGAEGSQGGSKDPTSSLNPLLEAVIKIRGSNNNKPSQLNHTLSTTFLPPLQAVIGPEICLPPLPSSPPPSDDEDDVPDVIQGEIARLEPRFKVWLSSAQPSGQCGTVQLVCQLDDRDLPAVPHIQVTIPQSYPAVSPIYPSGPPDYLTTPFLQRVDEALNSRLLKLPPRHTLSQLLTAWELSVRAACSPYYTSGSAAASGVLSGC